MKAAASISQSLREADERVAVVESLTSGSHACHLAPRRHLRSGSSVAPSPSSEVKFTLLGVDRGPVITPHCARHMTAGVARLTGADLSVAVVTSAGGRGRAREGKPAGTVFIAVHSPAGPQVEEHHFAQEPGNTVQAATFRALQMLQGVVQHPEQATDRPPAYTEPHRSRYFPPS